MLPANPNIQNLLMEIPFPPRSPQPLHLILIQPPPNNLLQLLPANLLLRLRLLARLYPRLEPRLHPYPHSRLERKTLFVSAYFNSFIRFFDPKKRICFARTTHCLDKERPRDIRRRVHKERLMLRNRRCSSAEKSIFIA